MESISKILIPFVCLLLIGYFSYHGFEGRYGLYEQENLAVKLAVLEAENKDLLSQKRYLEHRISLLKPESISKDLLDELARKILNFSDENDAIVWSNLKK